MDEFTLSDRPLNIDWDSPEFSSDQYTSLVFNLEKHSGKTNTKTFEGKAYINCKSNLLNYTQTDIPAWKLIVPEGLRVSLIKSAHSPPSLGHLGIRKSIEIMKRYFYWPTLSYDVQQFVSSCESCKENKAANHCLRPPLSTFPLTFKPWQRIYLDFLGPYPRTRRGNTSILIAVDHFSKFILTQAVRQATATEVVKFIENQIFLTFGVPESLVTDNGRQFTSILLSNLCKKYQVNHIFTAKYAPQANASERVNRTLLAAIRSYIQSDQKVWDESLVAVTHALRNAVHESTQFSPHFLVFGQHPVLNGSLYKILNATKNLSGNYLEFNDKPETLSRIYEKVIENLRKAHGKAEKLYNLRSRCRSVNVGQTVYVRNFSLSKAIDNYAAKLAPKYIKGLVTNLIGKVACEVSDSNGKLMGIYHLKDIKV